MNVGILGIGAFLPENVRTNDWWPRSVVEKWEQRAVMSQNRLEAKAEWRPGEQRVLEAMKQYANDPFRGAVERRVMPDGMKSSDMEIAAARDAIRAAQIDPRDIDFVLTYSFCPDELLCPNGFVLHEALGLKDECFTAGIEGACNSFLLALTLAESMIRAKRGKVGLIVQSCGISRILPQDEPTSAWFGDGAAAVVVGPVRDGRGIVGSAHRSESRLHPAVVTGVPGKSWYEDGRSYFYAKDRAAAFKIMVGVADLGKTIIEQALEDASMRKEDVSFFACHQISPWMRTLVQDFVGLEHAKSIETFHWAGNLASVNVPLVMLLGQREGLLKDGDVVAMYGGGAGVSYSAVVARWGR